MRDLHITQETHTALAQREKDLEHTIAQAQSELTQIQQVQEALHWLDSFMAP